MTPVDYLIIALALALYPIIKFIVLGYSMMPKTIFHEREDMLGEGLESILVAWDERLGSRWALPISLTILSLLAYPFLNWSLIDPSGGVRNLIFVLSLMLTWKSVTTDIDLATGRKMILERVLMIASSIAVFFYPGFLIFVLFIGINYLRAWQHHQQLLVRVLFFFLSLLASGMILLPIQSEPITVPALFMILVITASHYFVPGVRKLTLGNHWYSWVNENQLHNLCISAYMWGWCAFLPSEKVIGFVNYLKRIDRFTQWFTLLFELGFLFVLCDKTVAYFLLTSAFLFHLLSVVLVGIFFWQNMVTLLVILFSLYHLPSEMAQALFGWQNGMIGAVLMLAFPLRGILWRPQTLGWWDTPFIARADWVARGISGKLYGVYNDYMSPNDRLFGNKSGFFLSKVNRVNEHIGEAATQEIANAIISSGGNKDQLDQVKVQYGVSYYNRSWELEYDRYMRAFWVNFNKGRQKSICPWWLKAPGDQLFYWGKLPAFTGQEPVVVLSVYYREEFFDGKKIYPLCNDLLKTLEFNPDSISS